MPVVVALVRAPVAEAFLVLGPAFVALALGMTFGDAWLGIAGQAWGCVAGGLVLLAGLVAALARLGILVRRGAAAVLAFAAVECLMLAGLVATVGPGAPAPCSPRPGKPRRRDGRLAFEDRFGTLSLWERGVGTWQPSTRPEDERTRPTMSCNTTSTPRRPRPARAASARHFPDRGRRIGHRGPTAARRHPAALSGGRLPLRDAHERAVVFVPVRLRRDRGAGSSGKGLWPAFWLLPVGGGWPPEIDVMEVLGDDPDGFWATLHGRGADGPRAVQGRVAA